MIKITIVVGIRLARGCFTNASFIPDINPNKVKIKISIT